MSGTKRTSKVASPQLINLTGWESRATNMQYTAELNTGGAIKVK